MPLFTNQATLSFNGVSLVSNIITGEMIDSLAVTKNAIIDNYSANDHITYVISMVNSSANPLSNLTLTDNLGAYSFNGTTITPLTLVTETIAYYVNGILQPSTALDISQGPPLTLSNISVPANGSVFIVYETTTNEYAPLAANSSITNVVSVDGPLQSLVTATETVPITTAPVLSITKFLSPTIVSENAPLTYTFLVQNSGNTATTVADNLVLTDTFDPLLSDITVAYNGTVWTEGVQYTYDQVTGLFSTINGALAIPAASFAQDPLTGVWSVTPGSGTLEITGAVS